MSDLTESTVPPSPDNLDRRRDLIDLANGVLRELSLDELRTEVSELLRRKVKRAVGGRGRREVLTTTSAPAVAESTEAAA